MVFNVGSGQPRSVVEVAGDIARALGRRIAPEITGRYRVGDIRHCFADIGRAERLLGYRPAVEFGRGIAELSDYLQSQAGESAQDRVLEARRELDARGLTL